MALKCSPKGPAVKPSGGRIQQGRGGEGEGRTICWNPGPQLQTVCLNPKADFSLQINCKHTITFTYHVYSLPPPPSAAPEGKDSSLPVQSWVSSSHNSAWHTGAAQYLFNERIDQHERHPSPERNCVFKYTSLLLEHAIMEYMALKEVQPCWIYYTFN